MPLRPRHLRPIRILRSMKRFRRNQLAERAKNARYSTLLANFLESRAPREQQFVVSEWLDTLSVNDFRDLMNDMEIARGATSQAKTRFHEMALLCFDILAAETNGRYKQLSEKKINTAVRDLETILALVDLRDRDLMRIVEPLKLGGSNALGVVPTVAGIAVGKALGYLPFAPYDIN